MSTSNVHNSYKIQCMLMIVKFDKITFFLFFFENLVDID